MGTQLDAGCIQAVYNTGQSPVSPPTVQIIDVKKIANNNGDRYRLVLSDGQFVMQAMLATQQNQIVEQGTIRKFSVIQLLEFLCNVVQNRKIIIVLNLRCITHLDTTIGNPQRVDEQQSGGVAPSAGNGVMPPAHNQPFENQAGQYNNQRAHEQQAPYNQPAVQQPHSNNAYGQAPNQSPYGNPSGFQNQQSYPPQQPQYQPPPQQPEYAAPQYQQQGPQSGMAPQYPQQNYGQPPQQQFPGQPNYAGGFQQGGPQAAPGGAQHTAPGFSSNYVNNGPVQRDGGQLITPICHLNPYQNRWTIRARVMNKHQRPYSNARGEGKLFNMDVADSSGEIRISAFNQEVDAFWDRIEVGSCYQISGGSLKQANKQWNKLSHSFEITLNRASQVEACPEPEGQDAIPRQNFKFVTVDRIEGCADETFIDVLGVISQCDEPITYTNKKGNEVTKRTMQLTDRTQKSVEVTFFGSEAMDTRFVMNSVLAIKGAKVGNWNTKSLTCFGGTPYEFCPDVQDAHTLQGWWNSVGSTIAPQSISVPGGGGGAAAANARRICFQDIDALALGQNGTPDHFSVNCYITHVRTDKRTMWYIACPTCKKKVTNADEHHLEGHCEKCNKPVTGTRRWIFSGLCNDISGSRYVTFFDEMAMQFLGGKTADDLAPLKDQDPSTEFDSHFLQSSFQRCIMRCTAKSENWNDEAKLKITCTSFAPLNFLDEARNLLSEIRQMQ